MTRFDHIAYHLGDLVAAPVGLILALFVEPPKKKSESPFMDGFRSMDLALDVDPTHLVRSAAMRESDGVHIHLCESDTGGSGVGLIRCGESQAEVLAKEQMIFAVEPGLRSAIRSELRHRQGEAWPSRRVAVVEATSEVFRIGLGMAEALAAQLGEIEARKDGDR